MIRFAAELLKRVLSPAAFQRASYCWWCIRVYTLRRIAAIFIQRTSVVYGEPSSFGDRIRGVNTFAPTAMCRVMTKHGSDKGRFWHNYTTIYSELFGKLRGRPLRILELGIGTNNPRLPSNMGVMGRPGASLRGWRELFPQALVFGADIDRDILFTEKRIQTFYCDQLDSNAIRDLWAQPAMQGGMDIIVDDGLHSFPANTSFLTGSLEHLHVGGVYIIEDITNGDIVEWRKELSSYASQFSDYDFVLVELPPPSNNTDDNNLVMIRRRS
jgi:hypothetical protein